MQKGFIRIDTDIKFGGAEMRGAEAAPLQWQKQCCEKTFSPTSRGQRF